MPGPTIVFDLDGTLVDTAPDLIATLNLLFADLNIPPVAYAEGRRLIGGGVRPMIERGLAAQGRSVLRSELEKIYDEYIGRYAARIAETSRPFPGAVACIEALRKRGATLAICTNKLEWLSVRLLEQLDLARHFAAICGQDTFGVQKPDPAILLNTIARSGGTVGSSVMVGDSATDVATARAANVPIIAVDFGYTETPVASFSPDHLIGDFSRLPGIAFDLIEARA